MLPVEKSTWNFPLVVINDEDIDFSSIEKDFLQDIPPDTYLDSFGNIPQGRKVISGHCVDDATLPGIFGDESRETTSFGGQNKLDPAPSQKLEPVSLKDLSPDTETQQIISDDEDDCPIEAFPDDGSYICQYEQPAFQQQQQPPSQASAIRFTNSSFIRDTSSDVIFPSNGDFIDAFLGEKSVFQHPVVVSAKEMESVLSEPTISIENHNFQRHKRFRDYQTDQWEKRYKELAQVFRNTGLSAVHHTDVSKKGLARWIKRQRAQYKLRQELKPSSMTDERIQALNLVNFVWDSHSAAWEDRVIELKAFKAMYNHCNVTSSNYAAGRTLVSWMKSQRRQYRLIKEGKKSNLNPQRIRQLEGIGFQFS
jgi:hypothetical protein